MVQVGQQFGAYQIEALVGRGGMASVYKAYHAPTDRHVALKIMLPDIATDAVFRKRFELEARVLAGLQHVHILPVFDYGEHGETIFLVMPLMPGKTLSDRIQTDTLTPKETLHVFRQLASALDYAHARDVLHRDIKPGNIMLDASGNALLADFGLTRLMQGSNTNALTTESTVIGTPLYMSPEQGQGKDLDHRSDLYSLSIVLYEMLTGEVPFTADTPVAVIFKHVYDTPPSPLDKQPNLPPAVETVLTKALAKDPVNRYDSATEIADALEIALSDTSISNETSAPHPTKQADGEFSTTQADRLFAPDTATVIGTEPVPLDKLKRDEQTRRPRQLIGVVVAFILALGIGGTITYLYATNSTTANLPAEIFAFQAHKGSVVSMGTNRSGDLLITGGEDRRAYLWNLTDLERPMMTIDGHAGSVTAVNIRPDGEEYMTGGSGGTEFRWEASTGEMKITNLIGTNVSANQYSPDGELLGNAFAQRMSITPLFEPDSGDFSLVDLPSEKLNPNESRYVSLTFSPIVTELEPGIFQYYVVTADQAGYVQQWRFTYDTTIEDDAALEALNSGTPIADTPRRVIGNLQDNIEISSAAITQVLYSPEGTYIAASTTSGLIRIVASDTMEQYRIFPEEYGTVHDIAFSPDGAYLAAVTETTDVLVWEIQSAALVHAFETPSDDARTVIFTAGGSLVVGAADGMVYGWDYAPYLTTPQPAA